MRRKVLLAGGALLGAILFCFSAAALAQAPAELSPRTAEAVDVLRRGQQLENQRRWADALAHYEEAIREFPEDRSLERHFETARMHFDLGRRYNDASFRDTLQRLSAPEAYDLYDDVLGKIQAHYVESLDFKELVERGINSLDVALSEPAFVDRNLPPERRSDIDAFRSELRQALGLRMIGTRGEAREAAVWAARLAEVRLGMAATPLVLEFMCGATNVLDPYSAFLTPNQLAEVYSQIEGNFVGLGVELKPLEGDLLIVRVIPNSPAQRAGLMPGDRITAVDNRPTRNYSTDQAANMLQGAAGTMVELMVASPHQSPRQIQALRQRVEVPSIDDAHIVDPGRGVAYLKLTCFQKNTTQELDTALWQLHHDGMRSLIVDVRGNPGGLLVTAVDVVNRFVERGVIVSTHGRNPQEDFTYSAAHPEGTWRVPLTVLVDQDSASAAEIFAGAIRDYHRGTIIGTRTYGKGSVQGIFPLGLANAGVRLTTAKFYSPTGKPYARVGVEPDLVVRRVARPVTEQAAAGPDDPVLTTALQVAAQGLAAQR